MTKNSAGGPSHPGVKPATRFVTGGRDPHAFHGFVNPPVVHASTVLYPTVDDYEARRGRYTYGRRGTPTSEAFAGALAEIEGPQCAGVALLPSGLAAASLALQSVLQAGDHVLVTDNVYGPTRKFCDTVLNRCGVTTTYFDPLIGSDIAPLMQPNTRAVYLESPGSLSFEVQDVPAIAAGGARARRRRADGQYLGEPALFPRARKRRRSRDPVRQQIYRRPFRPDARRGRRQRQMLAAAQPHRVLDGAVRRPRRHVSRHARPAHHGGAACASLSGRAEGRALVRAAAGGRAVLHPALESCPGHAIWKRDFTGACGLFSIVLKPVPQAAVHAFIDALTLFGIGASWGGFESLVIPFDCDDVRSATTWSPGGPAVRFHIGLEDVDDLIADLERGFAALAAAR